MPTPIITKTNIITEFVTNITDITNTINSIPQLDKIETILDKVWYQDPTVWGAIATVVSAFIMAGTFFQIKAQQKKQEKDTQYREDKKELRDFIEKYMLQKVEEQRTSYEALGSKLEAQDLEKFILYTYSSLIRLSNYSLGLFYEDKLIKILEKISALHYMTKSFEKYSYDIKVDINILLHSISTMLYKALVNKQVFEHLINTIDTDINKIWGKLTPDEKEKIKDEAIKLYNAQNNI